MVFARHGGGWVKRLIFHRPRGRSIISWRFFKRRPVPVATRGSWCHQEFCAWLVCFSQSDGGRGSDGGWGGGKYLSGDSFFLSFKF